MKYMSVINNAPTTGFLLGGLYGGTVQGQSYTDPVTGQTFREDISPLGRAKLVLGNSVKGALGGLIVKGGTHLVQRGNTLAQKTPQYEATLERVKSKFNNLNG